MIAAIVWLYLALHLLLLEGWLNGHGWPRIDASACACLFAGLFARTGTLPVVLLGMALSRAALLGGDAALHFLILGIPVAVLVPLRRLFSRKNVIWQAACAALLAVALPRLTLGLGRVFAQPLPCVAPTLVGVLVAALLVPALTAVLRFVPPLSRFVEASECSSSRAKIAVVAATLVLALLVLVVHLANLMLVQREQWLERSAKNRWAFRDVPVRRGAILDRNGVVLVEDEPTFALWLDPMSFLQRHPYGQAAVIAARLGLEATSEPTQLLQLTLELPVSALFGEGLDAAGQKAVSSAAARLLSATFPAKPGTYSRALRAARGSSRVLLEVIEPPLREKGLAALAARLRSFAALGARVRAESGKDLGQLVHESARSTKDRQPQQRLLRRASFDLVAEIATERELWPGIDWLPGVVRRRALPGRGELLSLETVIGSVGTYGGPDLVAVQGPAPADEAEVAAVRAISELPPLESDDEDDDGLERAAEDEARRALQRHFHVHGRFGRSGVELACDLELRGTPGLRWVERDRAAPEKRLLASFDVSPGRDVVLSLDSRLQNVLEAVLENTKVQYEQCGVALVAAETGEVLALGGRPLHDGEHKPLWTTPALGWEGPGDLGSAAKPFVLLEQLDAARCGRAHADPETFIPCNNHWRPVPRQRDECEGPHGLDCRDPVKSLAKSCNFYFYQVALGLRVAGLRSAYERVGIVFTSDRPEGITGLAFDLGQRPWPDMMRLEQAAIGYGIEANPVQVARAYAALGTGRLPHLTLRADRIEPSVRLLVSDDDREVVLRGMRACVGPDGTARHEPILNELGVLAKTGTAEVTSSHQNNAWLAGLVPRSSGRMLAFAAACYRVEDKLHGGETAARIMAELLRAIRADPVLCAEYLNEARR